MKKRAFTLIELLVVIAIIGLLATIAVIALQNARAKARDARRIADIKQIQTALELYFNDMERYPTTAEFNVGSIYSTSTLGTTTYMAMVPSAPTPSDGSCNTNSNHYKYTQQENGANYSIEFCIGGQIGTLSSGNVCVNSSGLSNGACCGPNYAIKYEGGPFDSGGTNFNQGGYYRTVYIDINGGHDTKLPGQCWMRDNLNVGTMLCSGAPDSSSCAEIPTDNNTVEKYCYYNNNISSSNGGCSTDGALYQWDEAMQPYGSVTNPVNKGVCPDGWHIPTESEWHGLELIYANPSNETNCPGGRIDLWDCSPAGTALRVGGSSEFEGLIVGAHDIWGDFRYRGNAWTYFWSSSPDGGEAYDYQLYPGNLQVARGHDSHDWGFSVRCLKD